MKTLHRVCGGTRLAPLGRAIRRREGLVFMRPEKPSIDLRAEPGDVIVLTLIGDHDLATKPSLVAELAALAPEAAVVIDLTRCTFVDSTVIGAILNTRQPNRPRVSLVLPPDTSYVVRALSVLGVRDLLPVHPTVEAALEALEQGLS